jgi:diguanylate cyclase (GGDEF)-like protein
MFTHDLFVLRYVMPRETLQQQFTRFIWWLMFVGVGISMVSYGILQPTKNFLESGLIRVAGVFVCVCVARVLFSRHLQFGAGLVLLLINIATPFLINSGVFNSPFAILSIATLPTLFLSILWGWRGGLLALFALISVFFVKSNPNAESLILGWVIAIATAFSGSLIHHLISNIDQTQLKLEQMARNDPLTKLGNRFALESDFAELNGTGILSMWDVNGLKRVNDEKGHQAGDAYLLAFVKAYHNQCEDRLYRVGGDEFVGFHTVDTDVSSIYARVRHQFTDVSAGWVEIQNRNLDTVMRQADRAMYLEKGKRIASTHIE